MDKTRIESQAFPVFVVLDLASVALVTAGYFVPYWFISPVINVHYGLWFARTCTNDTCVDIWYTDNEGMTPSVTRWDAIRVFQSLAVAFGVISLLFVVLMCALRHKSATCRYVTQGMFFATSLLAGLMALVSVLLFIANVERSVMLWGCILPGVAAFLFIFSGVFSLVVCRYDPNYSLEVDNSYTIEQTHF